MTRAACIAVGLVVGLGLGASSLGAQITGPEVGRKGTTAPTADASSSPVAGLEWWSWSEDEAVAQLVYEPIKVLGAGSFGSQQALVVLKGLVVQADAGVRATVSALAAGEMDVDAAKRSLEEILTEFHSAVDGLLEEHEKSDSPGG